MLTAVDARAVMVSLRLRLRAAAELLREDIWIAVRQPGEYEGDGEADEDAVSLQWTTVAMTEDELVWPKETLALNASDDTEDDDEEEDLDPLD